METTDPKRSFVFYILPEFTMLAFACAVEALRLANHVLKRQAYVWRIVLDAEEKVQASCGVALAGDCTVETERNRLHGRNPYLPSMVVVCAGFNVADYTRKTSLSWLRECRQNGVAVAGLCSGATLLAQAGLLDDKKCDEIAPKNQENFPNE